MVSCLSLPSRVTGEINFWELGKNNARCVRTANLRTQRRWKTKKKLPQQLTNGADAETKVGFTLHAASDPVWGFWGFFFFLSEIGMER